MGYILTGIALILIAILSPFVIVYTTVKYAIKNNLETWYALMDKYNFTIAISLDQLGNVMFQELFNDILITKDAEMKFGDEDETISIVLAANYENDTLKTTGKILVYILELLDKGHIKNLTT